MDKKFSQSAPELGAFSIVQTAVAAGFLFGFVEVAVFGWQMVKGGRMGVNQHFVWMTPLFFAALGLLTGGLLAVVRKMFPRFVSWRASVFVPIALFVGSILGLSFPNLHGVAVAALASGIAVQIARLLQARPAMTARAARWTTGLLAVATVAVGTFTVLRDQRRERSAIEAIPEASHDAVNVLLLVLDTVGAQHLSLYGYSRPTSPQLERWAKRGVSFDRAIATAPWTLPSHATMMTGLYPHQLTYGWLRPVNTSAPTLAEAFRSSGYLTGAFVANRHYLGEEWGLARGFIRYEAARPTVGTFVQQSWLARQLIRSERVRKLIGTDQDFARPPAAMLNQRFLDWYSGHAAQRPFFAFVNYFDAHKPYIPPHDVFNRIAGYERTDDLDPLSRYTYESRRRKATADEIRLARDAYDAAIAKLDADMGNLLDEMERRGALRNTLVVIVSDHGEEFGEHGAFYHSHTVNAAALHVPLVIIGPGVPRGMRVMEPVTLRDLASTVTDIPGPSPRVSFPGNSLRGRWSDNGTPIGEPSPVISETRRGLRVPDHYPNARHDAFSIIDGPLHLIRLDETKLHLFDWYRDPLERHNLIGTPVGDSAVTRLHSTLNRALAAGPPR